jgi:hypothetical protein
MDDLKEQMRAGFRDLTARREAIVAVAGPLRDARDAFVKTAMEPIEAERSVMDAAIAAAETDLYDVNQEIGRIVRYLDGKTGPIGE